jgi:hypothetical protein
MTAHRSFAGLAAVGCPAYDAVLIALEVEFHAVDRETVAEILDELARPLFGIAAAPLEERAIGLAEAAWAALPRPGDAPPEWLFGTALERGHAAGAVRAALAVELGRRAGISARPARLRGCWTVHVHDDDSQLAADVGAASRHEPAEVGPRSLCAHELAFVVLTGVASAWSSAGDLARGQRASAMRLLLPLDERLRARVERDVRSYGAMAGESAP